MPTAAIGEGIYVGLAIAPSKGLSEYVNKIPPHIGEPLDPRKLVLDIMFPEELVAAGLGRKERHKLPAVARPIMRSLSKLDLIGSRLTPCYADLVADGNMASVQVEPDDCILIARTGVASIVANRMGIALPLQHPSGWRVRAARRSRKGKNLAPYPRAIPTDWVISGVKVGIEQSYGQTRHKEVLVKRDPARRR